MGAALLASVIPPNSGARANLRQETFRSTGLESALSSGTSASTKTGTQRLSATEPLAHVRRHTEVVRTRLYAVELLALVVFVAGCSSGGARQSSPTTRAVRATTTIVPVTAGSVASHVVANLSRCPATEPDDSVGSLNAGVPGLADKLVPITATRVRICLYESATTSNHEPLPVRLVASGLLDAAAASMFEDDTNRLPSSDNRNGRPTSPPFVFVSFASDTQVVNVTEACGCGLKTNGVRFVSPTTKWLLELSGYTTKQPRNP